MHGQDQLGPLATLPTLELKHGSLTSLMKTPLDDDAATCGTEHILCSSYQAQLIKHSQTVALVYKSQDLSKKTSQDSNGNQTYTLIYPV